MSLLTAFIQNHNVDSGLSDLSRYGILIMAPARKMARMSIERPISITKINVMNQDVLTTPSVDDVLENADFFHLLKIIVRNNKKLPWTPISRRRGKEKKSSVRETPKPSQQPAVLLL